MLFLKMNMKIKIAALSYTIYLFIQKRKEDFSVREILFLCLIYISIYTQLSRYQMSITELK